MIRKDEVPFLFTIRDVWTTVLILTVPDTWGGGCDLTRDSLFFSLSLIKNQKKKKSCSVVFGVLR